jgi:hypothetical protein
VRPGLKEFVQTLAGERTGIGLRDTDKVKPLRAGESGKRGLERRRL